ncbi:type II toxin-antitoxin system RelE/ParE family toxin [Oenococcus sp. UCMA 17063]|nr:type II toxin-antitoxin system RelE/ParE family toxin [Oenococcus sp. UCMA 17063]
MRTVLVSQSFQDDLKTINSYWHDQLKLNSEKVKAFDLTILQALKQAAVFPESYPNVQALYQLDQDTRRIMIQNYGIIYRFDATNLYVGRLIYLPLDPTQLLFEKH